MDVGVAALGLGQVDRPPFQREQPRRIRRRRQRIAKLLQTGTLGRRLCVQAGGNGDQRDRKRRETRAGDSHQEILMRRIRKGAAPRWTSGGGFALGDAGGPLRTTFRRSQSRASLRLRGVRP